MRHWIAALALFVLMASLSMSAQEVSNEPTHNSTTTQTLALTPPMGWNSYDCFGDSVTEEEVLANARYMKEKLLSHGWQYVVVDFRWYDPDAKGAEGTPDAVLTVDSFGRLMPAVNRFPSAADGKGFKPLADQIHAMGMKFGIHIMRGIPRMSVKANMPIEGSTFTAQEAANTANKCEWCPDMFGVDTSKPVGQAWYDSIFRLYASWGVDLVKVDDLTFPYSDKEVEAVRTAIDRCGRPMVFSTSPGETHVNTAEHVERHANMWRISADLWDKWKNLDHTFDLLATWEGHAGPGHWPDADMLPIGKIGKRCRAAKDEHFTHFTKDEQRTLMSLWALAPSPLMLGQNLPENDDWTLALITNDEVLAVNQDSLGAQGRRIKTLYQIEVWQKPLKDGSKVVGIFNRGKEEQAANVRWTDLGLAAKQHARDLWQGKAMEEYSEQFEGKIPSHGVVLLRLQDAQ